MAEIPVVQQRLPVVKIAIGGDEFPRRRRPGQNVGDLPRPEDGSRSAGVPLIKIAIDVKSPGQHLFPGTGSTVALSVIPQRRRSWIDLQILRSSVVQGQAGRVPINLSSEARKTRKASGWRRSQ
jgi:hypothetical protein